ncbi:hypothetical protein B0I35DRAFT_465467 [Stachybotrys elegans]|uniref:Uncharacterized protein n=1 Tax=Stachybotrys elegans TaxID=80388 RepID=A0A8K0SCL4_9HYPO|nr:hypothetical protein B0I35DRAFT_465467 [Stachybotrys elegans]
MHTFRKAVAAGAVGSVAGTAWLLSSSTIITPIPKHEAIWQSSSLSRLNSFQNPVLEDVCVKRVPLSRVRPELRYDEAALALQFCRGVWSGWAFAPQRVLFTRLFRTSENSHLVFSKNSIAVSDFELNSEFIDQFQVIERSSNVITVREGGSPRDPNLREVDGLITTAARIDLEKQEVELSLSTRLWKGKDKVTDGSLPVPYLVVVLHWLYAKALVQSGAQALR